MDLSCCRPAALGDRLLAIDHEIEGVFDIARSQLAAVAEMDAVAQMKNHLARRDPLDALSQVAGETALRIEPHHRIEHQLDDALGNRIGGVARIERGRRGLDIELDEPGREALTLCAYIPRASRTISARLHQNNRISRLSR